MNDSAWDRLTDVIDMKFGIASHGRRDEPLEDAPDLKRRVQYICWEANGKEYKAERAETPAVVDRKTIGSRRIGSEVRHQNVYDPSETTKHTHFFRKDGDDWQAIDAEELML